MDFEPLPKKYTCKQCYKKPSLRTPKMMSFCSEECRDTYRSKAKTRVARYHTEPVGMMPESQDELTYNDYKEPLTKVEKGFGYYGTVAFTKDRKRMQCHECGRLYRSLSSHVGSHGFTASEYKQKYKLAAGTKLIGDETREFLLKSYEAQKRYLHTHTNSEYHKQRTIANNKARAGTTISLEVRNKRGNCPDQLLDKIKKLRDKLGRVPSVKDFKIEYNQKHTGTIYYIFGSWTKACQLAGMTSLKEQKQREYSNEILLGYLQNFYIQHGRVPRTTDMVRGFLPSCPVYQRRFGSLNQARMQAGIPIVVLEGERYVETLNYQKYLDQIRL